MSVLLVTSIFCSWLSGTEPIYGKLIIYSFDFYKMSSAISFPTLATQCTYRELIVIIETNQSHRRIDLLLLNTLFPASFMFCLYCLMFEKSLAHLSTDERFWSMKSLWQPPLDTDCEHFLILSESPNPSFSLTKWKKLFSLSHQKALKLMLFNVMILTVTF